MGQIFERKRCRTELFRLLNRKERKPLKKTPRKDVTVQTPTISNVMTDDS